ncbi:MAG: response regulator transcription factor [Chitinophagaceae bacterium]|nr:response regulator transcription factor [Chitinophagaceae bacterium]
MKKDKGQILLVEDEESLRVALKLNLEMEGYEVSTAETGAAALKVFKEEYFDCIVLDIMIPEIDGLAVCEMIRLQNDKIPILFLSAKSTGADRVLGLKKGGDDYMIKPFNLEELLLRIEKLIEKNNKIEHSNDEVSYFEIGNCKIDFHAQECYDISGEKRLLTKKELQFLKLLVENKNEVITREYILKMVWGYNVFPTTRTIDNFITTFRKYFEPEPKHPKHFLSIRGVGYKFTI